MFETLYIKRFVPLYLCVFILLFFLRNQYFPAWYDACIQLFMLFVGTFVLKVVLKYNNTNNIFWGVLFFQLLFSFLLMYINNEVYGDIYGYNPIDGTFYRDYGNYFINEDFIGALGLLIYDELKIDDFGYPIIVSLATIVCNDYFLQCLVCLNAIVVAVGCSFLYKLSSKFLSHANSMFVALIWGIMPFAVNSTAKGLKENFFVFFVILSFYYLYKYLCRKRYYSLLLFLLFSAIVFLFRLVVGYALLLSYVTYLFFNLKFVRKNYKLILSFLFIVVMFSFGFLAEYVINQRGYEYDVMSANAEEKIGGFVGTITNYVAGFIGPIPSIVSTSPEKLTYITRYSSTPFLKMLISFYYWYAVFYIIRNKKIFFFPMITFYAINTTMLIFTFFTLHDRFQWPHIPIFIFLSAYGYMKSLQAKNVNKWYSFYLGGVLLIIFVYNFR